MFELADEMDDQWLVEFLFPEKEAIIKGYFPVDWEVVHKEPQKKNMTLRLLHFEYSQSARTVNKLPYTYRSYRSFCHNYREYAKKYKLSMPIRRKPGEIMEVDWAVCILKGSVHQS